MRPNRHVLTIEPLSGDAFRPFGDVIEASAAARHFPINDGYAERYHDLARVDVASGGGWALINIFRAKPRGLPLEILMLERHPLGSQAFMPLSPLSYLVVVAPAADTPDITQLRCFEAAPGQGVNYARGTWHHPLMALHAPCDFLVMDRGGASEDANCEVYPLTGSSFWIESNSTLTGSN
jgi:ureidoglycolate lyase